MSRPDSTPDAAQQREFPTLLSARDAARRVGVVERTVRRWIASGDLPAEKHGGRFLIRPEDVDEVFRHSRAATGTVQAEWRGRYLEVKERLAQVEAELAEERERRTRLERVLYMPPLAPREAA